MVKNILLQATTERKMMEDSAIAMRKKAANDPKTVFTFEDLIPAITVPSEDQIPVQNIEIAHICVDESRRRRGLGSALLVKAKEYTMERGVETAGAGVSEDDVAIRAFFPKTDFS
ncbi:MAG: GNAT family N-acetyltransferase [Lachnospiraceae bacterium]|nr:GNAT family N-acetyltransferase [Lachnospiraceae bacterium]